MLFHKKRKILKKKVRSLIREKSITYRSFINFWGLGDDFRSRIISAALPSEALMQIKISIKHPRETALLNISVFFEKLVIF